VVNLLVSLGFCQFQLWCGINGGEHRLRSVIGPCRFRLTERRPAVSMQRRLNVAGFARCCCYCCCPWNGVHRHDASEAAAAAAVAVHRLLLPLLISPCRMHDSSFGRCQQQQQQQQQQWRNPPRSCCCGRFWQPGTGGGGDSEVSGQ